MDGHSSAASLDHRHRHAARGGRAGTAAIVAAVFCLMALAVRAVQFGNPVIQVDEQFYLLVGDRIWAGDWPYVAAWDRKPVGLFLVFAGARALGGDGVLAYQLVATTCAAATAFAIWRIAATVASDRAALSAGALYLLLLMANGGDGGQAPVFYNLPVALAALVVVRLVRDRPTGRRARRQAGLAMLLFGIALQIKYSAVFEGIYFGSVIALLLFCGQPGRFFAHAAMMVAVALAPTGAAMLGYILAGHGDAFVFANFVSILRRSHSLAGETMPRLGRIATYTAPAWLPAIVSATRAGSWGGAPPLRPLLLGWAVAAAAGLLLFGTYHDHYALPLLVPLSVCAAPAFDQARWGRALLIAAIVAAMVLGGLRVTRTRDRRGTGNVVDAIAARVAPHAAQGLFVFSGDPILYLRAGAVPPTRFHFPTLLSEKRDVGTIGIDPLGEIARIMAAAPRHVVTRARVPDEAYRPAWAAMGRALAANYCLVDRYPVGRGTVLLHEHRRWAAREGRCETD